ncbi:MAG: hypothetical protein U9N83_09100 [Thermodesulfobacteriota bacterium]|nr:hypothetical protein [Thermodesulfobacteriota bacterium]
MYDGNSPPKAERAVFLPDPYYVVLENFNKHVKDGKEFLKSAKGVLVFPSVFKAGIGIGGEYGEGALRIGGKTVYFTSDLIC